MIVKLSVPINGLGRYRLRVLKDMLNESATGSRISSAWIHEQVLQVDDLFDRGCRGMRIPMDKTCDFIVVRRIYRDSAVHSNLIVQKASKSRRGHFLGNSATVEVAVLLP